MKLDRNATSQRRGKYALIKLRESPLRPSDKYTALVENLVLIIEPQAIDFGNTEDGAFFVIRLKDKYAAPALLAYGTAAMIDDPEYAEEVLALARMAAKHPNKRKPD